MPERRDARRNREAVIDAAIALLADHPEASMAEVAAASGVGRTTVYRHFPDREQLLRALYRRVVHDAQVVVTKHVESSRGDEDSDVVGVLVAMVLELGALGDRFRFLDGRREEAEEMRATIAEVGPEPLASCLAGAQAAGQVTTQLTVAWIIELLHHATHLVALQLQGDEHPPAQVERMLAVTLRGTIAPASP